MSDTEDHRAQRRIADQHFRPSALGPYRSMMRCRVNELLRSLVREPGDFRRRFR